MMPKLISRKDVINILKHHTNEDIVDLINKLPSYVIDEDADINTLNAQIGLLMVKDAYERKRLKGKICPVCGYEFKFGTPDEVEFHRVICVPSDDLEDDDE